MSRLTHINTGYLWWDSGVYRFVSIANPEVRTKSIADRRFSPRTQGQLCLLIAYKVLCFDLFVVVDPIARIEHVPDRFRQRERKRRRLTLKRQKQLPPRCSVASLTWSKATPSIRATSQCTNLRELRRVSYRSLKISTSGTFATAGLEQGRRRWATCSNCYVIG